MVYGEFVETPQVQYARLLANYLPPTLQSVYFTNSGAEAVEGAMKLAKKATNRTQIIAFNHSYHGSTQGALSIIGDEYWRNAFRPLLPDIIHLEYNSFESLRYITTQTACVIAEPVQAEAGIRAPSREWLRALRQQCTDTGTLLVLDEIQTGFGRTGTLWGFEQFDIVPDILLLGKALGGGMPLGAFISDGKLMSQLAADPVLGHITTFGGHPVCCAAGLAALEVLMEDNLIAGVRQKERLFTELLVHPRILSIRSFGFQKGTLARTFLWRISGNGLNKASYLYGTIHLTDKRVFQFTDSLYRVMENTDGFAAEIDMNSLGMKAINEVMAEKDAKAAREKVRVKDAVSARTWEMYHKKLEEKFSMPAEKITVDDLEDYESNLKSEIFKKGEMPTFLDAYLFGMARKQGKWTGGLEELEDQLEHINSESVESKLQQVLFDDEYYRKGLEKLTRLYLDQRLDSIEAMCWQSGDEKDYIMIKRNLKMARMMDSLSSVRSMVFAVGAAHLPGDSGVISLLRSKGFVVSPVLSSKKISADKYLLKLKETAWLPVAVTDSAYHLQMPGNAEQFNSMTSMGIDMKAFFDIANMKMFMTLYADLTPERAKVGVDSMYRSVKNRYVKMYKTVKEKNITVNGTDGREFTISAEDFRPLNEELARKRSLSKADSLLAFMQQANREDVPNAPESIPGF
ncbi:aminotransferase, class III [Ostertagia ostertagi]